MNASEKPFACNESGCNMTFTNEDHLNIHKKKHTMTFDLDLPLKNGDMNDAVADQTPTPTSFFRNCEEVGLFQDLQNVNPFEETFKKALENHKPNGLSVLNISSDGTLHTPHIFPHLQETTSKCSSKSDLLHSAKLEIDSFDDIVSNDDKEKISNKDIDVHNFQSLENTDKSDVKNAEILEVKDKSIPDSKSSILKSRLKLKEVLLNKAREKILNKTEHFISTPNLVENLVTSTTNNSKKRVADNSKSLSKNSKLLKTGVINRTQVPVVKEKKDRLREINRAAQIRCRNRKKIENSKMVEELNVLKQNNKKLTAENNFLKSKNIQLEEMIFKLLGERNGIDKNLDCSSNLQETKETRIHEKTLKTNPSKKNTKVIVLPHSSQPQPHLILNSILPCGSTLNTNSPVSKSRHILPKLNGD